MGHDSLRGNYEAGTLDFGSYCALRDRDISISEVLKSLGHSKALIGKRSLGMNETTVEPNKQGFDYRYGSLHQWHAYFVFRAGETLGIHVNENLIYTGFSNDLFSEEALSFGERTQEGPFFLYWAYTRLHTEILLPESHMLMSAKD
jgi:arylsulfatase A